MIKLNTAWVSVMAGLLGLQQAIADDVALERGKELYEAACMECHGESRLGGMGPALLPENLSRLRQNRAEAVIKDGRIATQMPAFGEALSDEDVKALVTYIYTPPAVKPVMTMADMTATHKILLTGDDVAENPVHDADPLNLFVVVESGDHHVTILDGDRFEPVDRFESPFALHGGAKFSPDGRYTYLASRDGWVIKYDMWGLKRIAEVRAGINTRNIAVSPDGKYVVVGNYLPHNIVVLDAETLKPVQDIPALSADGTSSRVSAVYSAPPRSGLVVALKDVPEAWELVEAEDPSQGGPIKINRIMLPDYLDDFMFDQEYELILGASRGGKGGQVINIDSGQKVADLPLEGMPHLGSGITWDWQDTKVFATPHLRADRISVIDMKTWKTVKAIETGGPGFFMRSHETSPYVWADVFFGPLRDRLFVIDKKTLEIVKTLIPSPGQTGAHVEFTKDGSHALVSILEYDGALVVYDAKTLEEVKRLPMKRPVGKYNVFNKTRFSEGTSH